MDRSYINGPYSRPYQSTCGMQCGSSNNRMADSKQCPCENRMQENCSSKEHSDSTKETWHSALNRLPLAMAYVPMQHFHKTFELSRALQDGTIFPELCKPFCGKRGMKR